MKIFVILVIKFFLISALFIVSNLNLNLKDSGDREIFFNNYYSWFERIFDQVINIVGYVVESKWLPENNFSERSPIFGE
ncbi:MAG: hypothetical protein QXD05_00565 [Candidatus Pacearchaeota archaeon]